MLEEVSIILIRIHNWFMSWLMKYISRYIM